MEGLEKEIIEKKEDILKNISNKINFLESKIQYLIDENAELKNKLRENSLENKKLDLILEKLDSIKELKKENYNNIINKPSEELSLEKQNLDRKEPKEIDKRDINGLLKEGEYYLDRYNNHEDLIISMDYLGEASDLGSIKASYILGNIYYENEFYKDIDLAIEYYKRASFGRYEEAIEKLIQIYENKGNEGEYIYYHYLGDIFFNGDFVEENKEKYMEYYMIAAEKGVEESINKLINIYIDLATQNDPEASFMLGEIYNIGEWVERDEEEAFDWYNKSETDGNEEGRVKAGELALEIGDILYEEEDIKCIEWYSIASEKENREAQYKLAQLFEKGNFVGRDEERALELYKRAAENGYIKALTKVKIIKPMKSLFNKERD
ncbi:tetratricopeptide repeat protein [Clostridium thermobutyricum]|uniref:Putative beta-lactamase HcpC n=1 Tax=Clostridium thermobutyricum DSM 4928 TaxID=1121339 RepID=A0A1V4SVJ0_9CLOT|nr:tetratricopeptide repeat protein [Clostridium thermobutyricum]OPX48023.1 putative beta-lactamase HcpC precursor [Clostridium thermobutyricum DSM 4928]